MNKSQMIELLKTDVPAWNQWREENPEAVIDLSGADLSYANLIRANFIRATLDNVNFNYANLGGADLFGAHFNGDAFDNAYLRGVNFFTNTEVK
jgi:hypothetical protein